MKLTDLDGSKFLFDPTDKKSYSKLRAIPEFQKSVPGIKWDKLIRYIILMYDYENKQVREEFPLYPQRKIAVCKLLELTDGRNLLPGMEEVLLGEKKNVNRMIVKYISFFNNPDLMLLYNYYEISLRVSEQIFSGKIENSTVKNLNTINTQLKQLIENVFGGKEQGDLISELYYYLNQGELDIQPEVIAEKLAKGDDPLDGYNAYEENYVIEVPRYINDEPPTTR